MPSYNPRTDSSALCRRGCPALATRRRRPCHRNMVECAQSAGLVIFAHRGAAVPQATIMGGAQSSVPAILADRGDAVPPGQPSTIMGEARSSVPAIALAHAARGFAVFGDRECWAGQDPPRGAQSLSPCSCRRRGRRPSQKPVLGGAQSSVPAILADRGDAVPPIKAS
jgi:hypothetical protein